MPGIKGTRLVQRNGVFYILETGDRRGVSTRTRDRTAAEACLAAFIQERARAEPDGELTVRSAIADYLEQHVRQRAAAPERQEMIGAHLVAFFEGRQVSQIEPADVAAYRDWRRAGGGGTSSPRAAKDASIRRELGMLTAAINHAVKKTRRLRRDQAPYIDLPPASVPKDHWLTETECEILLREARGPAEREPRIYFFVAIALETGARRASIVKLTRHQVDLKRGLIDFNPPGARQTKKRRPVVPISRRLRPIIERALSSHDALHVIGSDGDIKRAFRTAVRRSSRILRTLGHHERAEAMLLTTPHTLRHTWATLAAQHGVSLWDIAGVLGDTVQTVTKNYAHHAPDYLRSAVDFRRNATSGV